MKLRIKGNSLRLRLTRGEVQQLADVGAVEEQVVFGPGQTLTYRVASDKVNGVITAAYDKNIIEIRVPAATAREWCGTDVVSLSHSQRLPADELRLVIEKDFACLSPRQGEDDSDNFPHPQAGSAQAKC
jgi:hypothetical protein